VVIPYRRFGTTFRVQSSRVKNPRRSTGTRLHILINSRFYLDTPQCIKMDQLV
jgi:hypothetical protein